jgi:tRNA-splicing ligase RtcB
MKVFGRHDAKVLEQLARCVDAEEAARGVLCADGHYGYSQPVGGAVAYRDHVSPAGVGYDIGCGNKAVLTDLVYDQIADVVPGLMDEISTRIAFGVGLPNNEQVDHPVLDEIREAPVEFQRDMLDLAAKQLGTVGGGNHYVDLFRDERDRVWVGVHFGSRGFGHKTASHYFGDGPMDAPPELLPIDSGRGEEYIAAMQLAGRYAYAGRDVVVRKVLDILQCWWLDEVHNHHNYAWREEHDDELWWVVRKGCTPAFPGQRGFVGATMAGTSVILEGVDSPDSAEAFYSTVHGAGRAMSRTAAAGKSRKRWACNSRDCDWVQAPRTPGLGRGDGTTEPCPKCGHEKLSKRWIREVEGAIDWSLVERELRELGIELRGANAEEAPLAYKNLDDVLEYHRGTVRILHELTPIGVAMAPGDVVDPYKD